MITFLLQLNANDNLTDHTLDKAQDRLRVAHQLLDPRTDLSSDAKIALEEAAVGAANACSSNVRDAIQFVLDLLEKNGANNIESYDLKHLIITLSEKFHEHQDAGDDHKLELARVALEAANEARKLTNNPNAVQHAAQGAVDVVSEGQEHGHEFTQKELNVAAIVAADASVKVADHQRLSGDGQRGIVTGTTKAALDLIHNGEKLPESDIGRSVAAAAAANPQTETQGMAAGETALQVLEGEKLLGDRNAEKDAEEAAQEAVDGTKKVEEKGDLDPNERELLAETEAERVTNERLAEQAKKKGEEDAAREFRAAADDAKRAQEELLKGNEKAAEDLLNAAEDRSAAGRAEVEDDEHKARMLEDAARKEEGAAQQRDSGHVKEAEKLEHQAHEEERDASL